MNQTFPLQKVVKRVLIPSLHDGTRLEARVSYWRNENVDIGEQRSVKAVIISHPYGPVGGNYYNNVVVTIESFFLTRGYLTIAFNFRGVGNSKGRTSWSGEPESGDYKSMIEFLSNSGRVGVDIIMEIPKISDLTVIGYSYGSLIASTMASTSPPFPTCYILVSYPLSVTWLLTFFRSSVYSNHIKSMIASNARVLFIYGDYDQFTRLGRYRQWVRENNLDENPRWTVKELKGTDHFYVTRTMEDSLCEVLKGWVDEELNGDKVVVNN
ncbi:18322_t:CDS:2 [Acaulospora morrowiae]|uniref:18322_t:CDS:1 n=1 Tax=Acaulospora morrowiae TaxID=94023 RepID=A0A9N9H5K4_9GLOM|nr:18322_t:CDS:2 [Acaulospora morrowiae]